MTPPSHGIWNVGNEEYHADTTADSFSSLEQFRKSPAIYHHKRFVDRVREEPTEAMVFGTLVHELVLEPDKCGFVILPKVDGRTKEGKQAIAEARELAEQTGRYLVTEEQHAKACQVAYSVSHHEFAESLIYMEAGPVEQAIRWVDGRTDVQLKAKPDKLCVESEIVVDLKTTRDVSRVGFAKSAGNFGYHRQSALYAAGCREVYGLRHVKVAHVVVCTEPPYECRVYVLSEASIGVGSMQNDETLCGLSWRRKNNKWTEDQSRCINLDLPRWALSEDRE